MNQELPEKQSTSEDIVENQDCPQQSIDSAVPCCMSKPSTSLPAKSYSLSSESETKSSANPPLSLEFLNQLEVEANKIAASVDDLTENLTGILRSISALTLDCLETYRNCICNTCDTIDYNIKLMYQLMAKCEELSKIAEPLTGLSTNIKDIKNVLDLFDNQ